MPRRQALTGGVLCALLSAVLALPVLAADDKKATASADPKGKPSDVRAKVEGVGLSLGGGLATVALSTQ